MIRRKQNQRLQFSILGATISSVQRNILSIIEQWTGSTIKIGKFNDFWLYGNHVTIFGAGNIGALEAIRGNTVAGCLINECSMLEPECIKEAQDRCSVEGAQIIIDTNPTGSYEYTYTDIISKGTIVDKDTNQIMQLCIHFSMLDNTKLPAEYIKQQLMRYPIGTVDYERHILGKYCTKEGLIYYMYNPEQHNINSMPTNLGVVKYYLAQDFGFGAGHAGSLAVIARLTDDSFIVQEATVEENKGIEYWKEKAKDYSLRYNTKLIYADHARPDLIQEMRNAGFTVINANKSVLAGIDTVSELLVNNKLKFMATLPTICFEELSRYSWDSKNKEAPKKEFDNFLDSVRYGIHTEIKTQIKPVGIYSTNRQPLKYGQRK